MIVTDARGCRISGESPYHRRMRARSPAFESARPSPCGSLLALAAACTLLASSCRPRAVAETNLARPDRASPSDAPSASSPPTSASLAPSSSDPPSAPSGACLGSDHAELVGYDAASDVITLCAGKDCVALPSEGPSRAAPPPTTALARLSPLPLVSRDGPPLLRKGTRVSVAIDPTRYVELSPVPIGGDGIGWISSNGARAIVWSADDPPSSDYQRPQYIRISLVDFVAHKVLARAETCDWAFALSGRSDASESIVIVSYGNDSQWSRMLLVDLARGRFVRVGAGTSPPVGCVGALSGLGPFVTDERSFGVMLDAHRRRALTAIVDLDGATIAALEGDFPLAAAPYQRPIAPDDYVVDESTDVLVAGRCAGVMRASPSAKPAADPKPPRCAPSCTK